MKKITVYLLFFICLQSIALVGNAQQAVVTNVAAGVRKITVGILDKFTPYSFCAEKPMLNALSSMPVDTAPFNAAGIKIKETERGCVVEIPLADDEQLYGFGLQQGSFNQRGLRNEGAPAGYFYF